MKFKYCVGIAIEELYDALKNGKVPYTKEQCKQLELGYFTAMLHVLTYCMHDGCESCKIRLNDITMGEIPGKEWKHKNAQ